MRPAQVRSAARSRGAEAPNPAPRPTPERFSDRDGNGSSGSDLQHQLFRARRLGHRLEGPVQRRTHEPASAPFPLATPPAVQLADSDRERKTIRRTIVISPDAFARGLGREDASELKNSELKEYYQVVVHDDYEFALQMADKEQGSELSELHKALKTDGVEAFGPLLKKINEIVEKYPNWERRYATEPKFGYEHTPLKKGAPRWEDDDTMWSFFGSGLAPVEDSLEVTPSRGRDTPVLKQLPWDLAKSLLPRPLINLIFDLRHQLFDDQTVIDERTADERERKTKSPSEPGSLRSWHQDSPQLLPETRDSELPGSVRLDKHYRKTSQSGAGSSIKEGGKGPIGYAEYTGTGSNWEHNTKIVVDYTTGRTYLTLTHYQYWALVEGKQGPRLWNSGTQDPASAQRDLKVSKLKPLSPLMNPWLEIEAPQKRLPHFKPKKSKEPLIELVEDSSKVKNTESLESKLDAPEEIREIRKEVEGQSPSSLSKDLSISQKLHRRKPEVTKKKAVERVKKVERSRDLEKENTVDLPSRRTESSWSQLPQWLQVTLVVGSLAVIAWIVTTFLL